ncbi:hypothetical protein OUZ56_025167 [Daphnia magna]|uniref:Uncharacterized protein n=1 Tax=Daphnia magna TaxID=35525 RepID=A0ABQ9ZJ21_9CRUS|nr:hypothetical protein OUZ56_025167 [Daphnia magna]
MPFCCIKEEFKKTLLYNLYRLILPIIVYILSTDYGTRPVCSSERYAGAALLAIIFALPFSSRILFHNEIGPWSSFAQAFFHAHLELFLGNACLDISFFVFLLM